MKNNNSIFAIAILIIGLSGVACLESHSTQANTTDVDALVAKLIVAKSGLDRINILNKDSDFLFDFTAGLQATSAHGNVVGASRSTFPAVVGTGGSMNVGLLKACSINTPHIHPRATEFFFSTNGTFQVGFIAENGAREVLNQVEPNQATLFPMGSIHWATNVGCEPALFVSGFSNEDPGVNHIAKNFFNITPEVVSAAVGVSVAEVDSILDNLPPVIAQAVNDCVKTCGLDNVPTTSSMPPTNYAAAKHYVMPIPY